MAKDILPAPILLPKQTFKQRLWHNLIPYIYVAISLGFGMTGIAYILTNPVNFWFLARVDLFYTAIFLAGGFLLSLIGPPSISNQEIAYRRRLQSAANYFVNEDQIKFDLDSLSEAMSQLEKDLSPEQFSKLKDQEIIDYVIDQARSK